jgi:mRNA interferase YafQ
MFKPAYLSQFKKDYKKAQKRNKNLDIIDFVIKELVIGKTLDAKYLDHLLVGNYKNHRECHIENDWLLIYLIEPEQNSHSGLFRN